MPYTIVIDAGHGGSDPGAVYEGRREKDDNLSLAIAVGELLSRQGVSVIYTRTTDVYQTPFEKAQMANQADADFFISFHRNSSEEPNQYTGVETLVYDNSGIKQTMAENINGALSELGFRNLGVKARPGLVVLRRTKMPALLIETGFLNNEQDNTLYDEKQEEIIAFGRDIWKHAELGYREFRTAGKFTEVVKSLGLETEEGLAVTGVKAYLKGKNAPGPNLALMGEMDALPLPSHVDANPETGASHCCGHNAQLTGIMGAALALADPEVKAAA